MCSVAFGGLVFEIGFRDYQYVALPRELSAIIAASAPTGPATSDQFLFELASGGGERGAEGRGRFAVLDLGASGGNPDTNG